jgi:hypothetical protein
VQHCTAGLRETAHASCSGLHCSFLHRRASARMAAGRLDDALQDCDTALGLECSNAQCVYLRAQAGRSVPLLHLLGTSMLRSQDAQVQLHTDDLIDGRPQLHNLVSRWALRRSF